MLSNVRLFFVCTAALLRAQDAPPPPPDPVALVTQAAELCSGERIEDAILLLWRALAELDPTEPEHATASQTALRLLATHDPHDSLRQQAHVRIAKLQAGLATMYRRKKWHDMAASKLWLAERFDREAARAERIAFDKLRHEVTATANDSDDAAASNSLFDAANTAHKDGAWRPVDGHLESGAHDGQAAVATWLTRSTHGDAEIVLELRPLDPRADRNAGLVFGATDARNYYCARFGSLARNKYDFLELLQVKDNVETRLAGISERNAGKVGAAHRLVLHVRGSHLRFQVDDRRPIEADAGAPVRGQLGLCVGVTGFSSCPIRFERFDQGPLPGGEVTDAELQAQHDSKLQREILAAIERAKAEIASKNLETAAARLWRARQDLARLSAAADRAGIASSIDALLPTADRQHQKRSEAEQDSAAVLAALADKYAESGMPRAALRIVRAAAEFTPLELGERLSRAQQAVDAFGAARATPSTASTEPTVESSAVLREWFTEGRPLHSHSTIAWVVEGRSARVEQLERGQIAALMPRDGLPRLSRATIAVRLPSIGAAAGFCFDVAGSHDFAVAMLEHTESGVVLSAQRWRDRKWIPLGKDTLELPGAKYGSWLELEIEASDQGLTARSSGKAVTLGAAALGAGTGRYGLVVTNSGETATVELGAFRFVK